jgi:hypothetical protein
MMAARAARTDKTGAEATVGWLAGLSSGEELALQAQPLTTKNMLIHDEKFPSRITKKTVTMHHL